MVKVLEVRENLRYQRSLLAHELREIFRAAPPPQPPQEDTVDGEVVRKNVEGDW